MVIENINSIDIFGKRVDGGADLVIVSVGGLDTSERTQTMLLDKIENYLGYVASEEFKRENPDAGPDNTWIILRLDEEPDALILELLGRIDPWIADNGARFRMEVKAYGGGCV